jgi:hypothetical protein
MSLQRKLIRHAAADHISAAMPADTQVFASQSQALTLWNHDQYSNLPAVCVSIDTEECELLQESPREYRCEAELRIEAVAQGVDVDDRLDDLGHMIINAIARSNRLTYRNEQTVADIVRTSARKEFREGSSAVKGILTLSYRVTYRALEPDELDPEPLDDLRHVHTDYDLNCAQQPADRAADDVVLPT